MSLHILQCPACGEFNTIHERDWRIPCRSCYVKQLEQEVEWLKAVVRTGKKEPDV